ncbi:MAG: response regulator transcription factor [Thermoplasmata archaeon]|nr:response regulator transcription factor [Thermoplasmata archaeon]
MSVIKVLYVEDDPSSFHFLKIILYEGLCENVELLLARSGEEAMDIVRREDIHLILLDYFLPDVSGLELLEKIKIERCNIPVVLVTGYGDEKVATEAMRKGAMDYMVKWGNIEEMKKVLKTYIDAARCFKNAKYDTLMTLGKKRDTVSIICSLLRNAIGGIRKTKLIYKTNLNSKIIEKYLAYCLKKGYINMRGVEPIYVTTEKGIHLLKKLEEINQLLA